ncbi:MAG: NAD(P)-dependent oxidoreductase, partial [Bradyrhizobium sp.]|nr:NAD(P)-dependent oxidoreductase [Bradyrhizobium sp.]
MVSKATVLVTGSDGFIGRHLVPYLAAEGHKVIAASRSGVTNGPNITP